MNIDSTGLEKYRAILSARRVEGRNLFFSMATIVCRLTPTASANCCWVISFSARSTLILFFIVAYFVVAVHFKPENNDINHREQNEIYDRKFHECDSVYQQCTCDEQNHIDV